MDATVSSLPTNYAGRGVAVLSPQAMAEIDVDQDDYVRIESGEGTTYARVVTAKNGGKRPSRRNIKIDAQLRNELNVSVDDTVSVVRVDLVAAKAMTLSVSEEIQTNGVRSKLRDTLLDRAVQIGQQKHLPFLMDSISATIVELEPGSVGRVSESTEITIVTDSEVDEPAKQSQEPPGTTYEDIGGLDDEIKQVREMVELPLRHPRLFRQLGIDPPRGVLLYGPPGTGKTILAEAVSNETDASFISLSGPEIVSKHKGEGPKRLRKVFEKAKEEAPSIIFFDEIDAIAPKREGSAQGSDKRLVTQLLSLMDGIEEQGQIVVMGATNRVDDIDTALRRGGRFDREINVSAPDIEGRREILDVHTRDMPIGDGVDLERIAEQTHGFVGADIETIAREAAMNAVRRNQGEIDFEQERLSSALISGIKVTDDDFRKALTEVDPSAMREVVVETPTVTWEDIGGLQTAKQRIKEAVQWPLQYKGVYSKLDMRGTKGILLYGPPGTGKTMLAKAIANESNANFIPVQGPELISKWVGESEKAVRQVFETARANSPSIVFFDEIDTIASNRGQSGGGTQVVERVVSQLLTEMDGLEPLENVVVIATTNRKDAVDTALLRPGRFGRHIEVPTPGHEGRKEVFKVHVSDRPTTTEIGIEELAAETDGYSAADIEAICQEASMNAAREYVAQTEADRITEPPDDLAIAPEHFKEALKTIEPTEERADQRNVGSGPI